MLISESNNLIGGLDRVLGAGHQGSAHLLCDVACRHLIAQLGNGLGGGANPGQASVNALLRELRVLRQETVAGVHGVSTGADGNLNELVHHQVGLCRGGTAESVGFIGELYVLGVAVGVSIDGDGLQTLIAGCANHADSNFTAVSDQNLADRAGVTAGDCSKFLGGFCLVLSHLKLSFNLLLQGYIGRIGEYNAHHTVLSYRLVFNNVYCRARFETDLYGGFMRRAWFYSSSWGGSHKSVTATSRRRSISRSAWMDRPTTVWNSPSIPRINAEP